MASIKRTTGKLPGGRARKEIRTLFEAVLAEIAALETYVGALKTLVNQLRATRLTGFFSGYPGFAIDTNFDIGNANAFQITVDGVVYNIAASQTWDTGTAATTAAGKWCAFLLSVDNDATTYAQYVDNSDAGYASEALAIAALDSLTPSGEVVVGYVTNQAHASNTFTAGTDALQGGTGGNVSQDTNYYQSVNPDATIVGAAVSSAVASELTA